MEASGEPPAAQAAPCTRTARGTPAAQDTPVAQAAPIAQESPATQSAPATQAAPAAQDATVASVAQKLDALTESIEKLAAAVSTRLVPDKFIGRWTYTEDIARAPACGEDGVATSPITAHNTMECVLKSSKELSAFGHFLAAALGVDIKPGNNLGSALEVFLRCGPSGLLFVCRINGNGASTKFLGDFPMSSTKHFYTKTPFWLKVDTTGLSYLFDYVTSQKGKQLSPSGMRCHAIESMVTNHTPDCGPDFEVKFETGPKRDSLQVVLTDPTTEQVSGFKLSASEVAPDNDIYEATSNPAPDKDVYAGESLTLPASLKTLFPVGFELSSKALMWIAGVLGGRVVPVLEKDGGSPLRVVDPSVGAPTFLAKVEYHNPEKIALRSEVDKGKKVTCKSALTIPYATALHTVGDRVRICFREGVAFMRTEVGPAIFGIYHRNADAPDWVANQ
jgi:hypothetical protein